MRGLLAPAFTQEAMYQLTPDVLAITRKIFEKWASAEGAVLAYDGIKRLTFEVIRVGSQGRHHLCRRRHRHRH